MQAFGKSNACPVANRSEEVHAFVNQLRQFFARILFSRKSYNQRNIHNFFIKCRFLIPVMRSHTVSVVAGKDNDSIFPQVLFIYGIYNLTDFCIHLLYQTEIEATVSSPVVGSKMTGRISRIILRLLIVYHVSVVRVAGKVLRQSRPFILRQLRLISERKVLATCIFAYIMRIVESYNQEERFRMLLF